MSKPVPYTSLHEENKQLTSLVAASIFLHEQCNDKDLPEMPLLIERVAQAGKARGWQMEPARVRLIFMLGEYRSQMLIDDETPLSEKCSALKHAVKPLLSNT